MIPMSSSSSGAAASGSVDNHEGRPWLADYPPGMPAALPVPTQSIVDAFRATLERAPRAPAIYWFDETISRDQLDRASDAVAASLAARGIGHGDRVALYLQNDPQFVVAQLGAWKAGAAMVSVNPMLKAEELAYVLNDSGAVALVALDELYEDVARTVLEATKVRLVITTNPDEALAVATEADGRAHPPPSGDTVRLLSLIRAWDGSVPAPATLRSDDVACIGYTSGTSGRPKGVTNSHANILYNAEVYRRWLRLDPDDVWVCGAPLFHITGLVAYIGASHLVGSPMILFHRFDASVFLRLTERWRATATVMAITAFRALLQHPDAATRDLSSLSKVYSGGAPVSQAASNEWEAVTGHPIHNVYGLTETSSPSHAVPLGVAAPVDAETDAMSVGLPVPGALVRVVDESLHDVEPGCPGEILVKGPMVTAGYWGRPDANRDGFHEGYLRTGDVGKMDERGWFYVIDRLKDIINAAGYKVSPREVEDCLCLHPAVLEAAVVGVPDDYRGETVKAFVTLRTGASSTEQELVAFCRERLAAYKYPRQVEILQELPKTSSGKLLRRELRGSQ